MSPTVLARPPVAVPTVLAKPPRRPLLVSFFAENFDSEAEGINRGEKEMDWLVKLLTTALLLIFTRHAFLLKLVGVADEVMTGFISMVILDCCFLTRFSCRTRRCGCERKDRRGRKGYLSDIC